MRKTRSARAEAKMIALERISILLREARHIVKQDPELSRRYVERARRIGMKIKVSIPGEQKRLLCRKCNTILLPGYNCRVRTRPGSDARTVVTCLSCGSVRRYPLFPKSLA